MNPKNPKDPIIPFVGPLSGPGDILKVPSSVDLIKHAQYSTRLGGLSSDMLNVGGGSKKATPGLSREERRRRQRAEDKANARKSKVAEEKVPATLAERAAEEVVVQALGLGPEVVADAIKHAQVIQAEKTREAEVLGRTITQRLERLGAGSRFIKLASDLESGAVEQNQIMLNVMRSCLDIGISDDESDEGEGQDASNITATARANKKIVAAMADKLDSVISDIERAYTFNTPAMRQYIKVESPEKRSELNPEVDVSNPSFKVVAVGEPKRTDPQEIVDATDATNIDHGLEFANARALMEDVTLTHIALIISDGVFLYSSRAIETLDWENRRRSQLLGDSHIDRRNAVEELSRIMGKIKDRPDTSEKLRPVLAEGQRTLQIAIDDADEAYNLLAALKAKKASIQKEERLQRQHEDEERHREAERQLQQEQFKSGVDRAAVVEDIENCFEIDPDQMIDGTRDFVFETDRSKKKKRRKKTGGAGPSETYVTKEWAETYYERLTTNYNYKDEDINLSKLALLVRLRQELGGFIYESSDRKSRGYLVWVGEYQGQTCAAAELPVYGTATRVWAGENGERWQEIMEGGNLNTMGSHPVRHSHELVEGNSRSYTAKDNENHIKTVGKRIIDITSGKMAKATAKMVEATRMVEAPVESDS